RGRRYASGAKEHDQELRVLGHLAYELDRNSVLVRLRLEGVGAKLGELVDPFGDRTDVRDRLDDVPGARLAFATDHRRALVDPPQRLPEFARAADEGNFEGMLVDVK